MKLVVTGSSGMLGRALCLKLAQRHQVIGLDILKPEAQGSKLEGFIECDITDRKKSIEYIGASRADLVIHAAAYTDVDGCEKNEQQALAVNAYGAQNIALGCKHCGCSLIYISTDFVFDGEKHKPYLVSDRPNPINIYGKSKWFGEKFIQEALVNCLIVRSSWLFGKGGKNFVTTLMEKAKERTRLEVVNDQFGCPTYVKDLALGISRLIAFSNTSGIYHITNSVSCSWYELAQKIKRLRGLPVEIVPVSSAQYQGTKRPRMSVLDNRRYQQALGSALRPWPEALEEYLLS